MDWTHVLATALSAVAAGGVGAWVMSWYKGRALIGRVEGEERRRDNRDQFLVLREALKEVKKDREEDRKRYEGWKREAHGQIAEVQEALNKCKSEHMASELKCEQLRSALRMVMRDSGKYTDDDIRRFDSDYERLSCRTDHAEEPQESPRAEQG